MEGVSWIRDRARILDDINWEVKPGQNWALIGLNGSGKTSLLNLITGYLYPSKGEVTVLGNKFGQCDLRELRKSVGVVSSFLQEKFHVDEKVSEIVLSGRYASIGLYVRPDKRDLRRSQALMEKFGLSNLGGRRYFTLSQGEKQEVLLARAVMGLPKILIFDEPCTGLDLFARERVLRLVRDTAAEPNAPTLLYVSHHIEEVLPLFTHTILLRKGVVFKAGASHEVLTKTILSAFFEREVDVATRDGRMWVAPA